MKWLGKHEIVPLWLGINMPSWAHNLLPRVAKASRRLEPYKILEKVWYVGQANYMSADLGKIIFWALTTFDSHVAEYVSVSL